MPESNTYTRKYSKKSTCQKKKNFHQKHPPDDQDVSHARVKYSCKKIFLKVLNLREKNVQSKNPHLKIEMFPMSGSKPSNSAGTSSFSTVYSKNLQRFCLKEYCQQ